MEAVAHVRFRLRSWKLHQHAIFDCVPKHCGCELCSSWCGANTVLRTVCPTQRFQTRCSTQCFSPPSATSTHEKLCDECATHEVKTVRCASGLFLLLKWCPGAESNHRHEDFQSDHIFASRFIKSAQRERNLNDPRCLQLNKYKGSFLLYVQRGAQRSADQYALRLCNLQRSLEAILKRMPILL
ncbi:hypothetical protein CLV76_12922 [Marivita geojedonensis]|nr:hypothetical protein CLV76_12922 [Marivita geojedonensis]